MKYHTLKYLKILVNLLNVSNEYNIRNLCYTHRVQSEHMRDSWILEYLRNCQYYEQELQYILQRL